MFLLEAVFFMFCYVPVHHCATVLTQLLPLGHIMLLVVVVF